MWLGSAYEDMKCSCSCVQNDASLINDSEEGLAWHLKALVIRNQCSPGEKRPHNSPQCIAASSSSAWQIRAVNDKKCSLICVLSSPWTASACLFSALPFSFSLLSTRRFDLRFLISVQVFLGPWQCSLLEMNQPASLSDNNHNLELDLD